MRQNYPLNSNDYQSIRVLRVNLIRLVSCLLLWDYFFYVQSLRFRIIIWFWSRLQIFRRMPYNSFFVARTTDNKLIESRTVSSRHQWYNPSIVLRNSSVTTTTRVDWCDGKWFLVIYLLFPLQTHRSIRCDDSHALLNGRKTDEIKI